MRTIHILAACVLSGSLVGPAMAQGASSPARSACFIEVGKLMAIPELGAAIRQLDARLRPQVEEINLLKQEIARLEAPSRAPGVHLASDAGTDDFGEERAALGDVPDPLADRLHRTVGDLEAKRARLKLDYAEQMRAIVGPVQARVGERATVFGSERGCASVRMARTSDLADLRTASARDLTGDFVSSYSAGG